MESNGSIPIVRRHSILYCKCYALYYCSFLFRGFLDFARNDTKEMGSFDFANDSLEDDTERVIEKP